MALSEKKDFGETFKTNIKNNIYHYLSCSCHAAYGAKAVVTGLGDV